MNDFSTIGGLAAWIDKLLKVRFAKHASIMQCKLFTRAQLSSALFAGKARQMINTVASSPNPVCRLDPPSALCAPRTELPVKQDRTLVYTLTLR